MGAGTHLTANSSAAGWSTTPPAASDGCQQRELHPGLAKGAYGPLSCDSSNPRVLEAIFIDPPWCMCRLCPDRHTSDGGNPAQAACFLATGPLQAFDILFGIKEAAPAADGRRRALVPLELLDAATALATVWADVLAHVPESLLGALEPIADFTLDGPVSVLETPSLISQEEPYRFSVHYVFHASEASRDAVVEAINAVAQDPAFTCASWIAYTGVDMCALVQAALPPGFGLVNPWAKTLPAAPDASGRLLQSPSTADHRALFLPVVLNSLVLFGTKAFAGIGKGVDQFRAAKSSGKPMALEGRAMFVDSASQILGMAFGIWNLFGGSDDKYMPYLKQIDQVRMDGWTDGWGGGWSEMYCPSHTMGACIDVGAMMHLPDSSRLTRSKHTTTSDDKGDAGSGQRPAGADRQRADPARCDHPAAQPAAGEGARGQVHHRQLARGAGDQQAHAAVVRVLRRRELRAGHRHQVGTRAPRVHVRWLRVPAAHLP